MAYSRDKSGSDNQAILVALEYIINHATLDVSSSAAEIDAAVAAVAFDPSRDIVVQHGATDAASGALFRAAYTAAKALTPHGSALSATNRARLIFTGSFDITVGGTLIIDADFVDFVGLGDPELTVVYNLGTANEATARQTANDVRMTGFTWRNYGAGTANNTFEISGKLVDSGPAGTWNSGEEAWNGGMQIVAVVGNALTQTGGGSGGAITPTAKDIYKYTYEGVVYYSRYVSNSVLQGRDNPTINPQLETDPARPAWELWRTNNASVYTDMIFKSRNGATDGPQGAVAGVMDICGTWIRCKDVNYNAGGDVNYGFGWRCFNKMWVNGTFQDCTFGGFSVGSDTSDPADGVIKNQVWGSFRRCTAGNSCFGGCSGTGCQVFATFEDMTMGSNCIAMNADFGGTVKRCYMGAACISGSSGANATKYGRVLPMAVIEDCRLSGKSLGIGVNPTGTPSSYCAGTLRNVTLTATTQELRLVGATIENSTIKASGTNKSCVQIMDSNSKIQNSTLVATGSGNSITAADAQNVACLNVLVNLDKHANVTNTGIALTVNAAVN